MERRTSEPAGVDSSRHQALDGGSGLSRTRPVDQEMVLSPREKLYIVRRRLKLTQTQLGEIHGCTGYKLGEMELGRRKVTLEVKDPGKLTPGETCQIYRRRAGKRMKEVAASLGVSQTLVNDMELDLRNSDRLIWFWEQ